MKMLLLYSANAFLGRFVLLSVSLDINPIGITLIMFSKNTYTTLHFDQTIIFLLKSIYYTTVFQMQPQKSTSSEHIQISLDETTYIASTLE